MAPFTRYRFILLLQGTGFVVATLICLSVIGFVGFTIFSLATSPQYRFRALHLLGSAKITEAIESQVPVGVALSPTEIQNI
jgi:hypothetical protein